MATACAARFGVQRGDPIVSIVVPAYENWAFTERCIEAIVLCGGDAPAELIVVDDASKDETPDMLARLPGVNVVRNGVNVGFVRGCNRGAGIARGRYLFFLNNDTEIRPGAVDALVRRIERDERIGIVGSRLVYPNGTLQEAGGIIWSDGFAWNYGRLEDGRRPEYNFARDVDYVSGAALLVRRDVFRALGGFDERYEPAYYEDADLCFAVRARGLRVVYEPASVVIHHEGVTAGHDVNAGAKRYYEINRPKFVSKWYEALKRDHHPYEEAALRRAARGRGDRRPAVLVIAEHVVAYGPGVPAGSLGGAMRELVQAGHRVVLLPHDLAGGGEDTARLQDDGVEVLFRDGGDARGLREHLVEALPTVRLALIDGERLCRRYLPAVRAASDVPVVYRAAGAVDVLCAAAADGTLAEADADAERVRAAGAGPVAVGDAVALLAALVPSPAPSGADAPATPHAVSPGTPPDWGAAPARAAGGAAAGAGRYRAAADGTRRDAGARERDRLTAAVGALRSQLERERAAHRLTRRREAEWQLAHDEARGDAVRLAAELERARGEHAAELDRCRELLRHVVIAQAAADGLAAERAAALARAANAEAERDRTLLELGTGGIVAALGAELLELQARLEAEHDPPFELPAGVRLSRPAPELR
ncbi:MAG TPA: glycosyltransferase family 2 protein [Candidatus Elarobacter sp.]